MSTYEELMGALRGLHDIATWDIPPPDGDNVAVAPVIQIGSSGTKYVMMPYWVDGQMMVEAWGFRDDVEVLHDFLQFDR